MTQKGAGGLLPSPIYFYFLYLIFHAYHNLFYDTTITLYPNETRSTEDNNVHRQIHGVFCLLPHAFFEYLP